MSPISLSDIRIRSLLIRAGLGEIIQIEKIPGGGNNRVFRLISHNHDEYLLKEYFTDKADPRNRLKTEYEFLSFLWRNGIFKVPKPIAFSVTDNLGLYQYIKGRPVTCEDVTGERIEELISLLCEINQLRSIPDSAYLPIASDACFSVSEHLDHIEKRVRRLNAIELFSDIDQQAFDFVNTHLSPAWDLIKNTIHQETLNEPTLSLPLPEEMRVLSPSDFGFHNAILTPEGTLIFVDFEYAGWDDPVKTICDLFCQPKIPLDFRYFESTALQILQCAGELSYAGMTRLRLLYPAYRIKWCCILLNEFLPVGEKRRMFAGSEKISDMRKTEQLEKAKMFMHDSFMA